MLDTVLRLLPVMIGIAAGVALRRLRLAAAAEGEFVFRLVFTVGLPALMFLSVSRVELSPRLAVFAILPLVMAVTGYLVARLVARATLFEGTQVPVLLIACMMVNTGFTLPFTQALYGPDGVARVGVADAASAVITFSWAYWTAARGNPEHEGGALLVGRLLRSPPLYGVVAGLAVNIGGIRVPAPVTDVVAPFAGATTVLIALGTGILLTLPRGDALRRAVTIVATRLGTGVAVGVTIVLALGLDGVDRTLVVLVAVAPVAFVTVTFAALEKLDVGLATATLSLSLVTSIVLSTAVGLVFG